MATPDADVAKLISPDMLRNWVVAQIGEVSNQRCATALAYEIKKGEDADDGLTMRARACSDAELVRAVAVLILDLDSYALRYDQQPVILDGFTQLLGVDRKAAQKQATEELQEEYAARIAGLQAQIDAAKAASNAKPKAEKAVLPNASLAQPKNAREGGPKSKAKLKSQGPAGAAAPKMSAEEALSGIAAAMQGVDRSASAPDGAVAPTEATSAETGTATSFADEMAANRQLLGIGLAIGQKVRIEVGKLKGKDGEVIKDLGGDVYTVKVKGRSVPTSLNMSQLTVLEGAAA